jgi:hypothetical protein
MASSYQITDADTSHQTATCYPMPCRLAQAWFNKASQIEGMLAQNVSRSAKAFAMNAAFINLPSAGAQPCKFCGTPSVTP